jgi:hypothetical protein
MRWLNALQNKERDALKNMFSESAFLRYIGTDVNEVWSGKLVRETDPFNHTPLLLKAG